MSGRPRILLVGPKGRAESLAPPLISAGYDPIVVADFPTAKAQLDNHADLVITEVKLGAYNGLHLAIRASGIRTPAIIIGDHDTVLEADAARLQLNYLTPPIESEPVLGLISQLLERSPHTRRSTRKPVPRVDALVNDVPVHLCDVSYEGMRLEAAERDAPPRYFDVRLPQFNFSCRAQRVWITPAGQDESRVWCGAALASEDGETASTWRALVDAFEVEAVS
jgi:hypothetical protein